MRLVACAHCHTQFDVTSYGQTALRCHCGMLILITEPKPRTVPVARCGHCGGPWTPDASTCSFCGSLLDRGAHLPLICPECFARNPGASAFCRGCGVEFHPEPVKLEAYDLCCPRCRSREGPPQLSRRELQGCWVGECPACHGLWVARKDFERLARRKAEEARFDTAVARPERQIDERITYIECPECSGPMQRHNFEHISQVIIDRCGLHGFWLDADELERIGNFIAAGGLTAAREQDLRVSRTLEGGGPQALFTKKRPARRRPNIEGLAKVLQRLITFTEGEDA